MQQPNSLQDFCEAVRSSAILINHQMPEIKHPLDGHLTSVNKYLLDDYPELNYWHNCKHKVNKSGGKIIYGWAIFFAAGVYQAQHHAVWECPKGNLLDVTPDTDPTVLLIDFLPDGRVPYNFIANSHPVSAYYLPEEKNIKWGLPQDPNAPAMTSYIWYVLRGTPS